MAQQTADQIATWAERRTTAPPCKPKYKRLTAADQAYILKLRDQKYTQADIAQRIGCTQQAVSDWLRQCQDTSAEASLYLKGSALRMAKNIVRNGHARDHIAALKGINVLEEQQQTGLTVVIGAGSDVKIGLLSPGPGAALSEGE